MAERFIGPGVGGRVALDVSLVISVAFVPDLRRTVETDEISSRDSGDRRASSRNAAVTRTINRVSPRRGWQRIS